LDLLHAPDLFSILPGPIIQEHRTTELPCTPIDRIETVESPPMIVPAPWGSVTVSHSFS